MSKSNTHVTFRAHYYAPGCVLRSVNHSVVPPTLSIADIQECMYKAAHAHADAQGWAVAFCTY